MKVFFVFSFERKGLASTECLPVMDYFTIHKRKVKKKKKETERKKKETTKENN